jgi:hypothetical protein
LSEEISANFIKKWKEDEEIDEDMLDGLEIILNRFYIGNDTQDVPAGIGNESDNQILEDLPSENVSYAESFGNEYENILYHQDVRKILK